MMSKMGFLKNRYFITFVLFVVWIVFFDSASVLEWSAQMSDNKDLREKIEECDHETAEIARQTKALKTSNDSLEKYAREKYYLKKDNEEIFLIEK